MIFVRWKRKGCTVIWFIKQVKYNEWEDGDKIIRIVHKTVDVRWITSCTKWQLPKSKFSIKIRFSRTRLAVIQFVLIQALVSGRLWVNWWTTMVSVKKGDSEMCRFTSYWLPTDTISLTIVYVLVYRVTELPTKAVYEWFLNILHHVFTCILQCLSEVATASRIHMETVQESCRVVL